MPPSFSLTPKQREAQRLLGGPALHTMIFGGSRSGKTFLILRAIAIRALAAAGSRHAVLRFRFNHVKASVVADTWPKMLSLCFPDVPVVLDKTDYVARFPNGSEVWFAGLDDKDRTEKILGQEYVTLFLNECSQIPYASRNLAVTRLAQKISQLNGTPLRRRMFYDCNPPNKGHWTYKLFREHRDPDGEKLDAADFAAMQINPRDNTDNLPDDYLKTLDALPARMRVRFRDGEFSDVAEGALWSLETIERWRQTDIPDMQRIIVSVDPSGSGDEDSAGNDPIGIIVAGLGTDGNGYVLEDLTLNAGPKTWGTVAASAYDRHDADLIVAEKNFGGDMVRFVIQTARPKTPYKAVNASRGKVVRAEPISALTETGKIRFAGNFPELEDELCAFTVNGYTGPRSPNRADAMIWAMSELFPGMVREKQEPKKFLRPPVSHAQSWMGN